MNPNSIYDTDNDKKQLENYDGILTAVDYSRDAFLHNPVASATDTTGYVQRVPFDEAEADSYENMFDVPVSYEKFEKKE
ncbi:MAG: hypothetical protein E7387_04605 [Ruminococcaceae bacterium]|nr:hypothetical protein [Oscillospiraceae bacterium]